MLVYQSTYTEKVVKRFHMNKSHPLNFIMVVHLLEGKKVLFYPKEDNEKILSLEVPHLIAIGALIYVANYTWPNIAFFINLFARYNSTPTRRHWNEIKHILQYFCGITYMSLFYSKWLEFELLGYVDASYLLEPFKA